MYKIIYKTDYIEIENFFGYYMDSGAKHFITEYNDKWPSNDVLEKKAKKIRYNSFFSNGVNVNFYKIINKNTLEIKTYEKGIEKMMLSCASGSFACAYHTFINNKINDKATLINDGGKAKINISKSNYSLIGSAEIEYKSKLKI